MSTAEVIPHLELVPLDRVRFHEQPEHKRTLKLVQQLKTDRLLRNPPIVADMGDNAFLLLDGANRVSAFRELEYTHIPVQVVDYAQERIELKGWHHLLIDGQNLNVRTAWAKIKDTRLHNLRPAALSALLEGREVYAVLVETVVDDSAGGRGEEGEPTCWGLFPTKEDSAIEIHQRVAVMEQVVACYEGKSTLERIKLADFSLLPEVIHSVDYQLCLFPVLNKTELLQMTAAEIMIPTGLTRHLSPGRALGINIELDFLRTLPDAQAQQAHFRNYIHGLEMQSRIRFYEESVFIMNE